MTTPNDELHAAILDVLKRYIELGNVERIAGDIMDLLAGREKAARVKTLQQARDASWQFCAAAMIYDPETEYHEDIDAKRYLCYVPDIRKLIAKEHAS